MELVGHVAFEAERLRPYLPTYLHLLGSALFPIYIGAHASLSIPSSAVPLVTEGVGAHNDDFIDEEPEIVAEKIEGLTPKDAVLFPLLAGFTLSSLYFIIRWLEDPRMLNKILTYYFMQVGIFFGTRLLKDAFVVLRSICLPGQYEQGGKLWRVNKLKQRFDAAGFCSNTERAYRTSPLPGQSHRLPIPRIVTDQLWQIRAFIYAKCSLSFHMHRVITIKMPIDVLDALAISTSLIVVGIFTFLYKPWYVSNLLGFAFCYGTIQYMSPTTFWTGTLLLSALFFYDIYFVFFTPMMITVATKLDIPIKLLFPRPPTPAETENGVTGLSILGLGDVVIPGMMIALALRFDLYLHYLRRSKTVEGKLEKATYVPVTGGWGERFWVGRATAGPDLQAKAFPKTYFKAGLTGYTLGMIVTLLVMQFTEHGQPALLYLVPGVLISLWGTAALRGDLDQMWNYSEGKEATHSESLSEREEEKSTQNAGEEKEEGQRLGRNRNAADRVETDEELEPRTTKSESNLYDTLDEADSQASLDSGSVSKFDQRSSSESQDTEQTNHKAGLVSMQEEQRHGHLIWFSIDFPPPLSSTE